MPQLTGYYTGTNGVDTYTGEVNVAEALSDIPQAGISQASIRALAGNDTIVGTGAVTAAGSGTVTGVGIFESVIEAGEGDDSISAKGSGDGATFNSDGATFSKGIGIGYGVAKSKIYGRGGKDSFTVAATSKGNFTTSGSGLLDALISGGNDDDTVTIGHEIKSSLVGLQNSTGAGLDNSTVEGGSGSDTISISSKGNLDITFDPFSAVSTAGIKNQSSVQGGEGNDKIDILATSVTGRVSSIGVDNARVGGGEGNDLINIKANATGSSTSFAAGAANGAMVAGGNGDDSISVTGEGNDAGRTRGGVPTAYAVKDATVNGGLGNDSIRLLGSSSAFVGGKGIGAENATLNGGLGDDAIEVVGRAGSNNQWQAIGLLNSSVLGAEGNDRINIVSETSEPFTGEKSYGAKGSKIQGDDGNDSIKVRTGLGGTFDIDDTLIFGGNGDDTLDAGIGNGTLSGGAGSDTAVLDYLAQTVADFSITQVQGGVEITSNLSKVSGVGESWKQTILETETFKVGANSYSSEQLLATFG
jgi:Ca2+-binding RTX toxin-like protein